MFESSRGRAVAIIAGGLISLLSVGRVAADGVTHTVLPGIIAAFLLAYWLKSAGWITPQTYRATEHAVLFAGAIGVGVLSALLTEWLRRLGGVEATADLLAARVRPGDVVLVMGGGRSYVMADRLVALLSERDAE